MPAPRPRLIRPSACFFAVAALLATTNAAIANRDDRPSTRMPTVSISAEDIRKVDSGPVDFYDNWRNSHLSAEGIDPKPIAEAVQNINAGTYTGIDGLVLARNGALVAEFYFGDFGRHSLHQTRSTFKSVTGLLTGIAVADGLVDLDTAIAPLIARYHPLEGYDDRKARITVENLLQMQSGFDCSEMPGAEPYRETKSNESPDKVAADFDIPMRSEPGAEWHYCSGNTFLLGVALESALAEKGTMSLKGYLDDRLMGPLGIFNYSIGRTPKGHLPMHGGERLRPRDLAKFGQLLLSGGQWNGRQVVPEWWVSAILEEGVDTGWSWTRSIGQGDAFERTARYRFQWFQTRMPVLGADYLLIHSWGNGGQFIFTAPALGLVAVVTGSNYGYRRLREQLQAFDIMHRYVLPAAIAGSR